MASGSRTTPPKGPSPPVSTDSGRSLRRSPQKPQTPSRTTRSSAVANGSSSQSASSSQQGKQPSPGRPQSQPPKKRKPVFVSCVNFPHSAGPTAPPTSAKESGELQRSQRRSKQEAISKLDRAGTPTTQTSTGPAATSFVPPPPPPAGPSVQRNPLKRTRVVNPPFDLESVRTTAPKDPGPSNQPRLFNLPTCPSYHPTAEEFADPMAYIDSIAPEAKRYGICKIIPPEGWQMPFMLETDNFRFTTRLQRLNSMEAASRAKINFLEQLSMFHQQQGDATAYIPRIEHRLLDLWQLRKEVNRLGGVDEVNRLKAWTKLTVDLGYQATATAQVKAAYIKIVLPFEDWALRAKSYPESPPNSLPGSAVKPPRSTTHNSPSTPTVNGRMTGVRTSPRSKMATQLNAMSAGPEEGSSSANGNGALAPPAKIRLKVPGFQTSSHSSDSELSEEESSRASSSASTSPDNVTKYEKGDVSLFEREWNRGVGMLTCAGV